MPNIEYWVQPENRPWDACPNNIAPADGTFARPGYYLLFLVDHDRVPSVAKWIRLTP
jgi:hypothetical protein